MELALDKESSYSAIVMFHRLLYEGNPAEEVIAAAVQVATNPDIPEYERIGLLNRLIGGGYIQA